MGVYPIDTVIVGEKWYDDNKRRRKRIRRLYKKGYSLDGIAKKTGYDIGYIRRVALKKKM